MFSFLQKLIPGKKRASDMPPLFLYNTLSRSKEAFSPIGPPRVSLYNCGPTVYDEQHVGNLRGPVLANILRRALEAWGYRVRHVSNITDVGHLTSDADEGEDKMEASARKRGISAQEIAAEVMRLFFADLDALGIDRSRMRFPKATEHISEQISLIQALEEKGYAYKISDGVYFDTSKFKGYGALGQMDRVEQQEGIRVEENKEKKNPHDFALWKLSAQGEKRQQEWPSPWGIGFPGWHIECTAMVFKLLDKQIDIHIGGIDHIPVHHNNEIAQAEAITGKRFVRYWMHNAFITIEGKKISKSLGNTIYLRNVLDRGYSARALRYWYLTGHYRSPMNFTWETIAGADTALGRLSRAYLELPGGGTPHEGFLKNFYSALADDLDTPRALAETWNLVRGEGAYASVSPADKKASLSEADMILGLGISDPRKSAKLAVTEQSELPEEIRELVAERKKAREERDFARADELRLKIESLGYDVVDTEGESKISPKVRP